MWLKKKFPRILGIESTNSCNTNCKFCPREKLIRKKGCMNFKLFKKIIDEAMQYKNYVKEIYVGGYGEPLLDKDIVKKIKYIKSKFKDPIIILTTNASLLNKEISKRLIESGLDEMSVSLYSVDPKNYKKLQKLDYRKTKENLVKFAELKKKLNKKLPWMGTSFLCLDENKSEKNKWIKEVSKFADGVVPEATLHNYLYGRNYNKVKVNNFRLTCLKPQTTMQILWNGDVCACCYDFNGDIILGNIRNNSLYDVFNSKKYNDFCKRHFLMQFDKLKFCNICDRLIPLTPMTFVKRIITV